MGTKEQNRIWYQQNKARLSQERRDRKILQREIEKFGGSPYQEYAAPPRWEDEEAYSYLDFLMDVETE